MVYGIYNYSYWGICIYNIYKTHSYTPITIISVCIYNYFLWFITLFGKPKPIQISKESAKSPQHFVGEIPQGMLTLTK